METRKPLTVSASDAVSLHIETVTGKLVNPTDPAPESIDIHDIAWALSRIPRFAGHTVTEIPYNVAQHSVYVCQLLRDFTKNGEKFTGAALAAEPVLREVTAISLLGNGALAELLMKALLHDAHEAYIGDIPSPVKKIPELRETFKLLELKLDRAICERFGLKEVSASERQIIKFFDLVAQAIESYQFMPSRGLSWNLPRPSLVLIQQFPAPTTPLRSYETFIDTFNTLASNK